MAVMSALLEELDVLCRSAREPLESARTLPARRQADFEDLNLAQRRDSLEERAARWVVADSVDAVTPTALLKALECDDEPVLRRALRLKPLPLEHCPALC